MKIRRWAVLLVLAGQTALAQGLPTTVTDALSKVGLSADHLGVAVIPVQGPIDGLWHNTNTPLQPASTMKLVTSVVALEQLGPNHRGSTDLLIDGRVRQGVLQGALILRGRADPDLDVPALWSLLKRLRTQGVHEIRGDVVLDRSYFSPPRFDLGLPPFDEEPSAQYNVIPDALYLNQGILHYEFVANDRQLRVRTAPPLYGVTVTSRMQLVDGLCKDWDDDWQLPTVIQSPPASQIKVVMHGKFPRGCKATAELQLFDRDLLANRLIRQLWADLGGSLRGRVVAGTAAGTAQLVARHEARPLAEVLRHMNKASDNPLTRLMYLELGARAPADVQRRYATTSLVSEAVVRDWFARHEIATDGMVLDNGSGLSRNERVTPRQMAMMLRTVWQKHYAPELIASMPLVGVDGTMRNRLKQGAASARARIKTGTLRNVTAIAGYVQDAEQRWWVVVAMINHAQADTGKPALDAMIEWVASHPSAAVLGTTLAPTQP